MARAGVRGNTQVPSPSAPRACSSFRRCRHWYKMSSSGRRVAWEEAGREAGMLAWDGPGAAPDTGSLGLELSLESGWKVTEQGERPSELTGKEELLASPGLREEEEEEREALLRFSSLAALLCRLSVSKSSKEEFHVFRFCFTF